MKQINALKSGNTVNISLNGKLYKKNCGSPEMADYEEMFEGNEDMPLLVFHYGMTLKQVEDKLYERNIIIKGNQFINTSAITKN